MIRFLLRVVGFLFIAAAFFFLVVDGTQWIANGKFSITSVRYIWEQVNQSSLLKLQPAIEHHVPPWLWQDVIQRFFFEAPVWAVLTGIGAILMLIGRKKRPPIGYGR
jgi:Gpi18-like mannosyltransferase